MNIVEDEQQIERLLATLLPEIGKEIAAKYQQDTLEQRTLSYQAQEEKLEEQAHLQYQQLSKIVRMQHEKAIDKQRTEFHKQSDLASSLESRREKMEEIKYEKFKNRMKHSNVQELILRSQQMARLQRQISQQIQSRYMAKFEQEIAIHTKEATYKSGIKLTKELANAKKEIDLKIEQATVTLIKEVETERTSLATLRSKSNVLIKKLNNEKRELVKKCEAQTIQKQQLYEQLLVRHKELEKEAIESAGIILRNSLEGPSKQQANSNLLFQLISEHSSEKSISSHRPQQSVSQTHFQSYQMPYSRILDIDIKKYTSAETQSQNKSINQLSGYIPEKPLQRNFQAQYKKELQKMSRKNKLSAAAKNLIIDSIIRRGKEDQFRFVNIR